MYHMKSDTLDAPKYPSVPCFHASLPLSKTKHCLQRTRHKCTATHVCQRQHRTGLQQAGVNSTVAQGGHPIQALLTAGRMPTLPSMASGKQHPPPHPLPQPAAVTMCNTSLSPTLHFPASTRNIYQPSPAKERCIISSPVYD